MRIKFSDNLVTLPFPEWRQEEMERINAHLEGAERKAAMCMLFDQETDLLSAIERHKNDANIDNREKRIASFLEKVRYFLRFIVIFFK